MSATTLERSAGGTGHEIEVRPLQPTIGAEIGGVDLRLPLTPGQRDAIKAAVLKHKVVFFRDQHIGDEQHVAFAAQFGPLYDHPTTKRNDSYAAVHRIEADNQAKYQQLSRFTRLGDDFHSDTSWRLVPTWGAVLRAVRVPEVGGDTIWVDANLAYEGLPDATKKRLDGLYATHDFREVFAKTGHEYPVVCHPVVRTHRETGQKILWVNLQRPTQMLDVELSESKELLGEILWQYKRPENQVRFTWRAGSIAFWDNRAAVHVGVRNYGEFPRLLERILIADEPLYADL